MTEHTMGQTNVVWCSKTWD